MTRRTNNNMRLKSMEEFNCKISLPKFALAALVAILIALLFLSRENNDVVRNPTDTNLVKQTDTKEPTELSEAAKDIVKIEAAKTIDSAEDMEAIQTIEFANYAEKSIQIDSTSEIMPSKEQVYEDFIIPITEEEIGFVVRAVQHEVGSSRSFYPDADLDTIQQCMARVIINQVIEGRWGNSVSEILFYPGHFMPIERLWRFDPYEETTRRNVLTVLRGEDSLSSTITIEMSFSSTCTYDESIEIMESQVGPVIPYFSTVTAENRLLIFAESDKERLAEMNKKVGAT